MELLIKQRVFSWTDTYDIYDAAGEVRYFVKGKFFSLGHRLYVYEEATGKEVGSIHQKLFRLMPTFEIRLFGQNMGSVRKKLTFFSQKYHVDYFGWNAEGDFLGWDYRVTDGSRTVMTISQKLLSWGDTYRLCIENPRDEVPGLLLALAIDAANCADDND